MKRVACIVLPTYNEAENAKVVIPCIFAQAERIPTHDLHVVVIDDNSPDGTAAVVRNFMTTFPNLHLLTGDKKGLGDAYQRGMAYAMKALQPDLMFEMDADLQHDPTLLPSFVALANSGFSLVIGSRFISGGATPNFGWYRTLISLSGTWLVRLFGGLPALARTAHRAIVVFKPMSSGKCDLRGLATRGYSFQSSLLCELIRNGARVTELPIIFRERTRGKSKLSFRDQTEFLTNLFRMRLRR